jgi:hypothetical protein
MQGTWWPCDNGDVYGLKPGQVRRFREVLQIESRAHRRGLDGLNIGRIGAGLPSEEGERLKISQANLSPIFIAGLIHRWVDGLTKHSTCPLYSVFDLSAVFGSEGYDEPATHSATCFPVFTDLSPIFKVSPIFNAAGVSRRMGRTPQASLQAQSLLSSV